MTDEELAEIERAWAAATPGPWAYRPRDVERDEEELFFTRTPVLADGFPEGEQRRHTLARTDVVAGCYGHGLIVRDADAAAIAKAPEHVTALIAEVKRLRDIVDGAESATSPAYVERLLREGGAVMLTLEDNGMVLVQWENETMERFDSMEELCSKICLRRSWKA